MGSRITRALYKQERKLPIKKERQEDIRMLIVCFLGSINTLYFFLFGYLFRPHIRSSNSIPLFLIMIAIFLYLQLKQINRATLIASLALFAIIIISRIIGTDFSVLKGALILTTTALSAVSSFQASQSSFLQTFFLWLAYSSFDLGIKLSLAVSKINMQRSSEGVSEQESMIVQVIFSLVGIMSISLISVGKTILKQKRQEQSQRQTAFGKQFLYGSLNFLLVTFAFAFKSKLQHSFTRQSIMVAVAVLISIIFKKLQILKYLWIMVGILAIVAYSIDFITEGEQTISDWIKLVKMLMIDLAILDSVQKWIKWSANGTHKPILIVVLYFSSFYLSQFSVIGLKIFTIISTAFTQIILFALYTILQLIHRFDKPSVQYQEVTV